MPFSYRNKLTFALKLVTVTTLAFLAPVGIVLWQM